MIFVLHAPNFNFDLLDKKLEREKSEIVGKAWITNEDLVASKTGVINIALADTNVPATLLAKNEVPISPTSDVVLPQTLVFHDYYGDFYLRLSKLDDKMRENVEW